jgi:hypothetical protein
MSINTKGMDAVNPPRTLTGRREWSKDPDAREQAALRRVTAQIAAEAAELPPNTWLAKRLDLEIKEWEDQVLPQLAVAMARERGPEPPQPWVRMRSERCPLMLADEACLRRIAAILRAEATELGPESVVGAHLDRLGIRLALECESPGGMLRV